MMKKVKKIRSQLQGVQNLLDFSLDVHPVYLQSIDKILELRDEKIVTCLHHYNKKASFLTKKNK